MDCNSSSSGDEASLETASELLSQYILDPKTEAAKITQLEAGK